VEAIPDNSDSRTALPGLGLVPNTRAAIGEKGLEDLPIDAVLCGVQVQSPADTARRLVALWELLAPEHEDPKTALDRSWRLLAQHAVSGTIQAGGRFRSEATNIVFEHPGLIDLAGFEYEELSPSMGGFAGAFAELFERVRSNHTKETGAVSAARVVDYLKRSASKSPTRKQYVSKFVEMYNASEDEATLAFKAAVEQGRLEYTAGRLRKPLD
jgi:hypothetical protein